MGRPTSSTTSKNYTQAHERTAISAVQHPTKVCGRFVDDIYSILKHMYLENLSTTSTIFIKTLSLFTEEESNAKLVFLDTLWKHNNNKISVLVCRKPTEPDQYLHYSSHHQTCFQEKAISSLFNRVHSIITNKDDLTKVSTKISKG